MVRACSVDLTPKPTHMGSDVCLRKRLTFAFTLSTLNGANGETIVLNRRRGWVDALEPALFTNGVCPTDEASWWALLGGEAKLRGTDLPPSGAVQRVATEVAALLRSGPMTKAEISTALRERELLLRTLAVHAEAGELFDPVRGKGALRHVVEDGAGRGAVDGARRDGGEWRSGDGEH